MPEVDLRDRLLAAPTGYGLGRSGWVTIPFAAGTPRFDVFSDWIAESYLAVAPKTLGAKLLAERPDPPG